MFTFQSGPLVLCRVLLALFGSCILLCRLGLSGLFGFCRVQSVLYSVGSHLGHKVELSWVCRVLSGLFGSCRVQSVLNSVGSLKLGSLGYGVSCRVFSVIVVPPSVMSGSLGYSRVLKDPFVLTRLLPGPNYRVLSVLSC